MAALGDMDLGSFGGGDSADDEETNAPFSWRLSPEVSFSDWKIRVKKKTPRASCDSWCWSAFMQVHLEAVHFLASFRGT
jgi:hypothetical protein